MQINLTARHYVSNLSISAIERYLYKYVFVSQICLLGEEPGWTRVYDPVAQVPYYYNQKNWISYEDAQSVVKKVSEFLGAYTENYFCTNYGDQKVICSIWNHHKCLS